MEEKSKSHFHADSGIDLLNPRTLNPNIGTAMSLT